MNYNRLETNVHRTQKTNRPDPIRQRMVRALVGQFVSLMADKKTVVEGVVTDVIVEPEMPKIIVAGKSYSFKQILTNVPAALAA